MNYYDNSVRLTLGETLKKYRTDNGFTQGQVAEFLHIDRTTYTKYEHGRVPEIDMIYSLAKLYGVTVDTLIGGGTPKLSNSTGVLNSPNVGEMSDEELLPLSYDEKRLLTYYRTCAHPSNILKFAKKLYIDDVLNSEEDD